MASRRWYCLTCHRDGRKVALGYRLDQTLILHMPAIIRLNGRNEDIDVQCPYCGEWKRFRGIVRPPSERMAG
jgi:RNase P subunit RPR2